MTKKGKCTYINVIAIEFLPHLSLCLFALTIKKKTIRVIQIKTPDNG
jgi:hypothetical protein